MREIAFRAWFKNEFIYWSLGDKSNWFWETVRNESLKVEQFTGKKDSNKNKIYDGDIAEIRFNNGNPSITIKIEWSENQCGFHGVYLSGDRKDPCSNYYSLSFSGSVVGGIYLVSRDE